MTIKEAYQSLKNNIDSRFGDNLKQLQAMTSDDAISAYKVNVEELSVQDGKYPGTGGIRTFVTGRDKLTYDFIDLDKYYISDEVDLMLEEEKSEREAADQTLQDNIDKETERAEAAEQVLQDNIDKETERAEAAEQVLQDNIDKETERAEAAEQVLQDNIDKETERAEAAEQILQDNIDKEEARAEAAEADLQQQIYDETARAEGVEESLQQQITDEIARATATEEDLQNQLNNETARAKEAEEDLQDQLNEEISRAKDAEENLQNQLNDEISRAKDAEADLQSQLDKEITRAETAEANEESARNAADQNIVDWSKGHFVDVINTIDNSPLTLETSYNYNSDGYKVYTIHGTVDCYSKDDVKEMVDGLELDIYSLQSQINAITGTRVETVTDINASGTSPLTLSASKSGNIVTITGSVDLSNYYTKSLIDSKLSDISASIPSQVVSSVKATSSSNILTISPSSKTTGDVTISVGISESDLKLWLENNGYKEGGGDVDLSNYYTKSEIDEKLSGLDVNLSDYQKKLEWYSEGDDFAQIAVGSNPDTVFEVERTNTGLTNIHLYAENGSIFCSTGSFLYNNCEVATQCWVQDYVASTSSGGESVYPTVSTSIPTSVTLDGNKLYTGSISGNTSISFTGSQTGAEVQLIIYANNAATVSFSGGTVTDGYSSISVASGKYLEVNAVYDGNTVYIRSGYSE